MYKIKKEVDDKDIKDISIDPKGTFIHPPRITTEIVSNTYSVKYMTTERNRLKFENP